LSVYLKYWRLTEPPFENVPDRQVFFRSSQHEEALSRMMYAVENRKGVAMLTGEVGSGKTTIGRVLNDALPEERYQVRTITNPALSPLDLLRSILFQLGIRSASDSKFILLTQLYERLAENEQKGVRTILIIDEAHLIQHRASLEELRMLLNMQSEHQFLITLIILGQPPLLENIETMHPLKERISIKYHLQPLDLKDSVRYILFRLKNAGADRGIFTRESIFPLYDYSRGVPLRINNLSDRCLLIGMMRKATGVDTRIVNEAIADLQ
jgi:type II secretory pathway predicted ATPase ExeA